jgi:hypothetical protein
MSNFQEGEQMTAETITPPRLAKKWGIHPDKVRKWIASGELRAMNLGTDPNGRPRYRILIDEVERFEASRSTGQQEEADK